MPVSLPSLRRALFTDSAASLVRRGTQDTEVARRYAEVFRRLGGGICWGKLWFLCVRRIPDYIGFLSDMHWFPDAFRARLSS
jgi:hypothetical protein